VDSVEEADRFAQLAETSLPAMARLLEFVWRRHMQAATRRAMLLRVRGDGGTQPVLAVGFADMVGFTGLSQQLSQEELAAVVSRFEEVAHDTVTGSGGRVVKMIGDEVMFITETVDSAARIGLSLAEAYADDDLLSDVRVALAVGPVLVQDGDYFGPVVNLASRAVSIANPGSVLISDDFHQALLDAEALWLAEGGASRTPSAPVSHRPSAPDAPLPEPVVAAASETGVGNAPDVVRIGEDEFVCKALRPRHLKDLGRLQLWVLSRFGVEAAPLDRRVGRRWERLGEVLRELDDLRERGERLMTGGDWNGRIRTSTVRTERTRSGDQVASVGESERGESERP
jgi:adenylate cyclase